MALEKLTDAQLEVRLDFLEARIAQANPKDLPYLCATFRKILEEQVRRDLAKEKVCDSGRD